jgi:LuxR family transcriptional regulator, maltose regulon positive regulatory protein
VTAGVGKAGERDLRGLLGPSLSVVDSKLRPLPVRPGTVPRTALVDRLLASHAVPVILVVAPPGYGKTTLLAQWAEEAERVGRPVAWLCVDRGDNDPVVLLAGIAAALNRVQPIDPGLFGALASPGGSVAATLVPRVVSALSAMPEPFALVLDHVELLHNPACRDAVAELAVRLPGGRQLVIASRDDPPLPRALLRARGQVVDVGVDDLAMDHREARALLEGAGVRLDEADMTELIRRTEGWPVGLYLAALAIRADGRRAVAEPVFAGDDRLVADYLRSELLSRLSPKTVSFLTRTAVLDRMCGPLCDAVLGTRGSGRLLESLERSNVLLVALDRHRDWYRYHHLFRDLLRAELERREPELVHQLHARAAGWCEANGMPEMAIDHARAAGDADRVARLVASLAFPTYAAGRVDTSRWWLQWFEDHGLVERYPPIAVIGAVTHALLGDPGRAERWAAAAERAPLQETLPDGSTMESWLAHLRMILCRDGVHSMRHDAELARGGLAPGSPWRASALLAEGISYLLDDEPDRADPILAHAVDVATDTGALPAAAVALAERAIVAIERDDWGDAETLAGRALTIVQDGHLDNYAASPIVFAAAARTAARRGDPPRAQKNLARAARLRPLLTYAIPAYAVQTRLELARAYLALADAAGARTVLREVRDVLHQRPDLGTLPQQADQLRSTLDTIHATTVGASSLTTSELRLVPLLSTHLSFREIGERLHISRHTVKTQAISVYRKLGVSTRSEAIERAHEVGLLAG